MSRIHGAPLTPSAKRPPLCRFVCTGLFVLLALAFSAPSPAVLTLQIDGGAAYTKQFPVSLEVGTPCAGGGVTGIEAQNAGGNWQTLSGSPAPWSLEPPDGTKSVNARAYCVNTYVYQCGSYCCNYDSWGNCTSYCADYCTGTNYWQETAQDDITLDMAAPSVVTTVPLNGANPVPVTLSSIAATFSENVTGVTATSFTLSGGITGSVSYDASGPAATFVPSSPLANATLYTVSLSTVIGDLAGNPLQPAGYTWQFTTPPRIAVTDSVPPGDDLSLDFGDKTVGTTRDQTVTAANNGATPLHFGSVAAVDPLAEPYSILSDPCSGQSLAPGASCTLAIRFAPTTAGANSETFSISTDDAVTPSLVIHLSGNGVIAPAPHIAVSDSVAPIDDLIIDFGSVTVDQNQNQTLTITNSGNADLVIGSVGGSDPLAAPFSVTADGCSGETLAPAENCAIVLRFAPGAIGEVHDTLDIASNDGAQPSLTFHVAGNGTPLPAPRIGILDSIAPDNDLSLPFGDVTVQEMVDHTVTIANTGNADLVITGVGNADPLAAPFSLAADDCSDKTLAPGAQCTVTIRYAPAATGVSNDSFNVSSNDADLPMATINVSGTGLALPDNNNPPSAPALIFPADKQSGVASPVVFRWNKSTDPDGDSVGYELYTCTRPDFSGCEKIAVAATSPSANMTSLGGFGVFAFVGVLWLSAPGRRPLPYLIAAIALAIALMNACSSGGGGGSDTPQPPPEETTQVSSPATSLDPATTYYWKVMGIDGKGGATSSEIWSFTTK